MNPFEDIIRHAQWGALEASPQLVTSMRSGEFAQLTAFDSEETEATQVQALLYLLARYPVHPAELPRMLKDIPLGVVRLTFLELSNPVPYLLLPPGHPSLDLLVQALEQNAASPRGKAARALVKWKDLPKRFAYQRWERACLARYRATLPWPGPEDYRANREQAQERSAACARNYDEHERHLRESRAQRMQKLREAAGLAVSWHAFLTGLAEHLLSVSSSMDASPEHH